jgi:hypothetical protein
MGERFSLIVYNGLCKLSKFYGLKTRKYYEKEKTEQNYQ